MSNVFNGTDAIDEAVTAAASVLADEYFIQNEMEDVADDHDDSWYELREKLRGAMLDVSFEIINNLGDYGREL